MGWRVQGLEGRGGGVATQSRPSEPASETVNPPVNPGRINNVPLILEVQRPESGGKSAGRPCERLGPTLGSRLSTCISLPRPRQTDQLAKGIYWEGTIIDHQQAGRLRTFPSPPCRGPSATLGRGY